LGLGFQPPESLFLSNPLVGQLGLKIANGRLGLVENLLCVFAGGDLLPQCLPRGFKLVDCRTVIESPMDNRNWDLTIANETTWRTVGTSG
jgi:hypothetical protein